MQTLKSITPWNLSGEFCEKWNPEMVACTSDFFWVWFVQSLWRKIIAVSFVESWFDAGIWGQIKAIYCSQLAGCFTSPCSSEVEPEAVGLKTGHLCCSRLTMLQNFRLRKRGQKCQLGSGWGRGIRQTGCACIACLLTMHKMLEETLNWFSLSCKPRVIPPCSRINKWFVVYTVHSLM